MQETTKMSSELFEARRKLYEAYTFGYMPHSTYKQILMLLVGVQKTEAENDRLKKDNARLQTILKAARPS